MATPTANPTAVHATIDFTAKDNAQAMAFQDAALAAFETVKVTFPNIATRISFAPAKPSNPLPL